MFPPDRVRRSPRPGLPGRAFTAGCWWWWSDVRKIRLPVGAVVLQDGEEAGDPVELPARPVVCPLRRVVPVMVDIKLLPGGIAHKLRRPHLVHAVPHQHPHEPRGPAEDALHCRVRQGQARRARSALVGAYPAAVLGHGGRLEEGAGGVEEGVDLGGPQEGVDVYEEWVEGDDLRAVGSWLADKRGVVVLDYGAPGG